MSLLPEFEIRPHGRAIRKPSAGALMLSIGALGVVFGDIGTSPLYAVQTVFAPGDPHRIKVSAGTVYGATSLIFWALLITVTIKYVLLVMRADNDGEGGVMALITLLHRMRDTSSARMKVILIGLGVFGAALFYGDSMITPSLSVLSAVEGLKVVDHSLAGLIVPLAAAILIGLFCFQRFGTETVGRSFGPIMIIWFLTIATFGTRQLAAHPGILRAISPSYAISYLSGHGLDAFLSLGAIVLAVTGAEALYADMGHFGRRAITRAWLWFVFPALVLTYLGEGALILHDHAAAANPFYLILPEWLRLPMVFLATIATVIASQAVISGTYSITRQAVQQGYLPRLRIIHTSEHESGQVYVPLSNWTLLAAVLILVVVFGSAERLAWAYGVAVTGTFSITTLLFFYYARRRWQLPLWLLIPGAGALLCVDLGFFSANLAKVLQGGWMPLLVAGGMFTLLMTWSKGREIVSRNRASAEGPLDEFIEEIHAQCSPRTLRARKGPRLRRIEGTAVFLNRGAQTAPLAMRANVEHNHVLHEHVVILTIDTLPTPHVPDFERVKIDNLGTEDDGIMHVTARYGYRDDPDVPAALRQAEEIGLECPLELDDASFFLSKIDLQMSDDAGMARWRKSLFLGLSRVTADPVKYFRLPPERTVVMGARIPV